MRWEFSECRLMHYNLRWFHGFWWWKYFCEHVSCSQCLWCCRRFANCRTYVFEQPVLHNTQKILTLRYLELAGGWRNQITGLSRALPSVSCNPTLAALYSGLCGVEQIWRQLRRYFRNGGEGRVVGGKKSRGSRDMS